MASSATASASARSPERPRRRQRAAERLPRGSRPARPPGRRREGGPQQAEGPDSQLGAGAGGEHARPSGASHGAERTPRPTALSPERGAHARPRVPALTCHLSSVTSHPTLPAPCPPEATHRPRPASPRPPLGPPFADAPLCPSHWPPPMSLNASRTDMHRAGLGRERAPPARSGYCAVS
ncbi:proline-rich protein HaeIII subfamily 1-like [Dermochelys coriacea]|uniref:proline-rich protein HaeIII subfamily 1-like n=1 Tax=Dermochelys coriacea TaxID=27794 RepID=UPI001CA918D5|nr:proline-rich protein HaeIII subfamily 1-like [Dermochelys coriacea]